MWSDNKQCITRHVVCVLYGSGSVRNCFEMMVGMLHIYLRHKRGTWKICLGCCLLLFELFFSANSKRSANLKKATSISPIHFATVEALPIINTDRHPNGRRMQTGIAWIERAKGDKSTMNGEYSIGIVWTRLTCCNSFINTKISIENRIETMNNGCNNKLVDISIGVCLYRSLAPIIGIVIAQLFAFRRCANQHGTRMEIEECHKNKIKRHTHTHKTLGTPTK